MEAQRCFKRADVLRALLPLVSNSNEQVAERATSCFDDLDAHHPDLKAAVKP